MAKIDRFNGNLKAFASEATGTNRTLFGEVTQANDLTSQVTADFKLGWQIVGPSDQPTLQDFNGAMYTHGQLLSYLHQAGVAEWNGSQEYFNGSVTNRLGSLYRCLTATHVSSTVPENDPTNWRFLSGGQTITGSTVFTNATNSIFLPGIGSIGFEVGDVIQVTNTADNDNLYTVEVITNANNIIVNQAHAGGTTTKSLSAETADAVVRLISKWYNAPNGLGQGWIDFFPSGLRIIGVTYTNNTGRPFEVAVSIISNTTTGDASNFIIDDQNVGFYSQDGGANAQISNTGSFIIPSGSSYSATATTLTLVTWAELR